MLSGDIEIWLKWKSWGLQLLYTDPWRDYMTLVAILFYFLPQVPHRPSLNARVQTHLFSSFPQPKCRKTTFSAAGWISHHAQNPHKLLVACLPAEQVVCSLDWHQATKGKTSLASSTAFSTSKRESFQKKRMLLHETLQSELVRITNNFPNS